MFEKSPRADVEDVAVALNNLGALYVRTERLSEAEALLDRAAAAKKMAFGSGHPLITVTLNNLAVLRRRRREFASAAALYEEARGIFEQSLGADHPKTIACRKNEVRCSAEAGDIPA